MYHVYTIGPSEEQPYLTSYVGVTNNVIRRWKAHAKATTVVGTAIQSNNWDKRMMRIIYTGTADECFALERMLRPTSMIGLNEAVGGKGGFTKYTNERNAKVSAALKGRKVPWIHKTIESRRAYTGKGNPHSKKWTIVSPNGDLFKLNGDLNAFAKTNNLSERLLRSNLGNRVPAAKIVGYGGFRSRSPEHLEQRNNTTGWKLDVDS